MYLLNEKFSGKIKWQSLKSLQSGRFVNSTRRTLVFQNLWKDLCAVMGATLLVPRHRHHLEGRSAETAGSRPQGEERGRQARGSKDIR